MFVCNIILHDLCLSKKLKIRKCTRGITSDSSSYRIINWKKTCYPFFKRAVSFPLHLRGLAHDSTRSTPVSPSPSPLLFLAATLSASPSIFFRSVASHTVSELNPFLPAEMWTWLSQDHKPNKQAVSARKALFSPSDRSPLLQACSMEAHSGKRIQCWNWISLGDSHRLQPYEDWRGFPGGSVVRNPSANAEDTGSNPGLGRSPGGGNATHSSNSCLENPMDGGAWRATVHRDCRESDTTEQLRAHTCMETD